MTIWRPSLPAHKRPLYLALSQAIEADILARRLRPGDRLPTHRQLAEHLGVTVGTVTRGYAEAQRAGWISGEVGRGTFVLDQKAGRFARREKADTDLIDLSLNSPVDTPAPDLAAALRAIAHREDVQSLLRYGSARDSDDHRLAGAMVLEQHGLAVEAENVVVCAGAQHGVGAALEAVLRSGDCVLAEELTYPAFRPIAEAHGLRVCPVTLDEQGIVPDALDAACRKVRPKALYTIPTLHNPTTATLSAKRRNAVAEVARRHNLTIIEDDIHRMLAVEAPPPMAAIAPERTIYVASVSKCFAPGLRIGYLAAPPALRERLADAVWRSVWTLSPVATALATHWVLRGEFASVVAAKRREAAARQAIAAKIFPRAQTRSAETAYHLWLRTGSLTAEEFALRARAHGVLVTPSSAFYLGSGAPPAAVRVSLSAAQDRSILTSGLQRLRQVGEGFPGRLSATL